MAKMTQGSGQYESPQATKDGLSTEAFGGSAPTHVDVIKSANARAQKRHEMKGDRLADENVLPDSSKIRGNEMVGIKDSGYLAKKGIPYGVNAMFNTLPPGMDIEDQENADIRKEPLKVYSGGLSYPDDGWKS
jgi:hypothetical protein